MSVSISGDGSLSGIDQGLNIIGNINASSATITGNVSIAGTVTYEDTTNVDSIGVITARSGIVIGTGTSISSPTTNVLTLGTNNSERVRIDSGGRIITGNYSTALDTTAGSIVVNGDTSGGRIVTRGSSTSADASLGEFFGFWDTNKVAGIIFSSGSDTTNKDDGTIKFYTSSAGPSVNERARLDSNGSVFVGAYANAYDNPGRFNVSNTSRVSTTSGAYVPSNGGFVDYARFEMISNCVTSFPANNNKIMARNGAPLLINNTRDTWSHYTSLPNYLLGSLTHDCINNASFTVTLACTMTVFLLRDNGWNPVDLSGWNLIESGGSIGISAISNGRLYVKTLSAGSNVLNNNSAMYFFVI